MKIKYYINLFLSILKNIFCRARIVLVYENVDWVIKQISRELEAEINKIYGADTIMSSPTSLFLRNRILHFMSISSLVKDNKIISFNRNNKAICTWYHVLQNDDRLKFVSYLNKEISFLHTSCQTTKEKLLAAGINQGEIVVIPESIDLSLFSPVSSQKKIQIKNEIGLPENKIIIGSFQKDGVGWGEGFEPKMEKGPDVFCDAVEKIARQYDIHVLLTGPARGYVKERLVKAKISFTHCYLKNFLEIVNYYNALDYYIVASRVEGGPKAILESMACGVPIICTRMGMALDVIEDRENGMLADVENVEQIYRCFVDLANSSEMRQRIIKQALEDVKKYDLSIISRRFYEELYLPLLDNKKM